MDPISILSIVGAALSVTKGVSQAIQTLTTLKSRYRSIPLQLSTLIGQLYTVQAALEQIAAWSSKDLFGSPRYEQLAVQIDTSLHCFCPLILALQQHLDELDIPEDTTYRYTLTGIKKKISFLWDEKELTTFSGLLDRQVNALNLFLQAIQCKSLEDQQNFINDEGSRSILKKAKDCDTSIIGLSDGTSILSEVTNTNSISHDFDFDAVLLGSRAYTSAHRSILIRAITTAGLSKQGPSNMDANQLPMTPPNSTREGPISFRASADDRDTVLPAVEIKDPNVLGEETAPRKEHNTSRLRLPIMGTKAVPRVSPGARSSHGNLSSVEVTAASKPREKKVNSAERNRSGSGSAWETGDDLALQRPLDSTSIIPIVTARFTLAQPLQKLWHTRHRWEQRESLRRHEEVEEQLRREHQEAKDIIKVLLLGTSASGKTTLLENMRLSTGTDYTDAERTSFNSTIQSNLISGTCAVLEAMHEQHILLPDTTHDLLAQALVLHAQSQLLGSTIPSNITKAIMGLWASESLQKAYNRNTEHHLMAGDSTPYFASHIERLAASGYIPSREDILRSRTITLGITETTIRADSGVLQVFDVGGVRSERRKWIHCFEKVNSVVFTVDVSAYCRVLMENDTQNSMVEQLDLWDSVSNSRWFLATNFVLVFTKLDRLPETLKFHPVSACPAFANFQEPDKQEPGGSAQHVDAYLAYLESKFLEMVQLEERRRQTKIVYADLVNVNDKDSYNAACAVLDACKVMSGH